MIADKRYLAESHSLPDTIEECPEGIVIPVDKPFRWTSADVIRKLKFTACRHFGRKGLKVGHAGTLDPLATGVLLVCIGKATRMAEELQRHDKEYIAEVAFGATTPSYDREKPIDRFWPLDRVSEENLRSALPSFVGEQEQVAPLFSAKSVDGKRAYELARRLYRKSRESGTAFDHEKAEILTRQQIRIDKIELLAFDDPEEKRNSSGLVDWTSVPPEGFDAPEGISPEVPAEQGRNSRIHLTDNSALGLPTATLRIACSKGTYIRALARDLGEKLGSGAHLSALQRSATGGFRVENALTVDEAMALFGKSI